jgi:hypothetical protein
VRHYALTTLPADRSASIPPGRRKEYCLESRDAGFGTHAAMICSRPYLRLLQGAEEYLRHLLTRPHINSDIAQTVRDAFDSRDTPCRGRRPR